jgi:hypothetical protein
MKMKSREYLWSVWQVLKNPWYAVISTLLALLMIMLAAWLPNLQLVGNTITTSRLDWGEKYRLLAGLTGSIATNFQPEAIAMIIASSLLAGIQVALVIYYMRQKIGVGKEAGMGIMGVVSSLLGVGCASCGSVILTSFLGLGVSGVVLSRLPWHGVEFALIGFVIILMSTLSTAKKLYETQFCKLK